MAKKTPVVSVDIVVVRSNNILLGRVSKKWSKKGKYQWGLPGRAIVFGNNFAKTVKKNLKSELGITLKKCRLFSVNNNFGFGNHYVTIGIVADADGEPRVMKPEDWTEWKWFSAKEIPPKLFPSAKLTLRCFLENKVTIE